jgi:hypothetical protein
VPTGLTHTTVTPTSATVKWNAIPGALSYNFQYKKSTLSTWMTVTGVTSGLVNVGMIFPVQGGPIGLTRAFTVTAFGTGKGNLGTYTVAPNDGGSALTTGSLSISSTNVAGSGNIVLSNSMTPSSGTAKFEISTSFTYSPEV